MWQSNGNRIGDSRRFGRVDPRRAGSLALGLTSGRPSCCGLAMTGNAGASPGGSRRVSLRCIVDVRKTMPVTPLSRSTCASGSSQLRTRTSGAMPIASAVCAMWPIDSSVKSECCPSMKMKSWPVVLAMRAMSLERARRTFIPSATLPALQSSFRVFGAETAAHVSPWCVNASQRILQRPAVCSLGDCAWYAARRAALRLSTGGASYRFATKNIRGVKE